MTNAKLRTDDPFALTGNCIRSKDEDSAALSDFNSRLINTCITRLEEAKKNRAKRSLTRVLLAVLIIAAIIIVAIIIAAIIIASFVIWSIVRFGSGAVCFS